MTSESSESGALSTGSVQQYKSPAANSQAPVHLTYQHGLQSSNVNRSGTSTQPYYSPQAAIGPSSSGNPSYYAFSSWPAGWPSTGGYAYPVNYQASQQGSYAQYQPRNVTSNSQPVYKPGTASQVNVSTRLKAPTPSPSPPPPESYRHWDEIIVLFLKRLGLTQAVAGFEADILVMNPVSEQKNVRDALEELNKNISVGNRLVSGK